MALFFCQWPQQFGPYGLLFLFCHLLSRLLEERQSAPSVSFAEFPLIRVAGVAACRKDVLYSFYAATLLACRVKKIGR